MTNGKRQRIRCVIRFRDLRQFQNAPGHIHDLPLFRFAVSDNRLFHLQRCVFLHRDLVLFCAKDDDATSLCHVDHRLLV